MILRVARHTNRISEITEFYSKILGLNVIGNFQDHNGYDGVFLGKTNSNCHLEFTTSSEISNQEFDEDDLLVFYPENESELHTIIENIKNHHVKIGVAKNPYWNDNGILINDPDGFGVIINKCN